MIHRTHRAFLRLALGASVVISSANLLPAEEPPGPRNSTGLQAPAEPPVEVLLHANGSVTITVDGEKHLLPGRIVRKQLPKLLSGRQAAVIRMEEWKYFESNEHLSHLYEAGIRKLTLQATIDGNDKVQTIDLKSPPLGVQLASPNRETRHAAINTLENLLKSEKSSDRANAMAAIKSASHVRFDRTRFLPLVRKSLNLNDLSEFSQAIGVIALVGGDASDVRAVVAHVNHENPRIRAALTAALYGLDPLGKHADIGPAIVKLLTDAEPFVRTATFKSLWGLPSTPDVDARLIELSRGPSKGGSSEADEVIYYALSTRPLVRGPVVERSIEIIFEKGLYSSRAVWGLSHNPADDAARPRVVEALINVLDTQTVEDVRRDALFGLGLHGTEKALKKLNAVIADENESQKVREYAYRQLRGRKVEGAAPVPATPTVARNEKPAELWEQIVQPQDAQLRKTALMEVQRLLRDKSTAAKGLSALVKASQAPFDRAPFLPLAKPLLLSDNAEQRALALAALVLLEPQAIDAATIATRRGDDSPLVRQAVAEMIVRRESPEEQPLIQQTIELLLNDADTKVVQSMIRSLWGRPTSLVAEETLIDLSFNSVLGDDVVYYALSTRPLIRQPVAERLIDLTAFGHKHRGRAIWGLSHHIVDESANDLVVTALIDIVDTTADNYDRLNAIQGLARLRGPIARERLEKITSAADETEAVRNQVIELLRRQDESPAK